MELVEPTVGWKDLEVPRRTSGSLKEFAEDLRRIARFRDTRLPRTDGALFVGRRGTGRRRAAEVLAGDIGLALLRVDCADLAGESADETEENLERVFRAAEQADAVLFFDEADAIFGKRAEVGDDRDRYANAEVERLLRRLEAQPAIVILATNAEASLPEALRRRLRWCVDFEG